MIDSFSSFVGDLCVSFMFMGNSVTSLWLASCPPARIVSVHASSPPTNVAHSISLHLRQRMLAACVGTAASLQSSRRPERLCRNGIHLRRSALQLL